MKDLLNQLYGRRSTIAPGDSAAPSNRAGQGSSTDQPGQPTMPGTAAPENYLPFGWAGLQVLLR
jgi:hypothetical protein